MRQPSKNSLSVAEELLDHVNYGLTRPDIIREWAEVMDEHRRPLLEALCDLMDSADMNAGVPDERYVQRLRALLADFQPQPEQMPGRRQPQSFVHAASRVAE
ncbi:MAG: hypothetical protein ACREXY_27080 [Gammaproteobacteria bacterium]